MNLAANTCVIYLLNASLSLLRARRQSFAKAIISVGLTGGQADESLAKPEFDLKVKHRDTRFKSPGAAFTAVWLKQFISISLASACLRLSVGAAVPGTACYWCGGKNRGHWLNRYGCKNSHPLSVWKERRDSSNQKRTSQTPAPSLTPLVCWMMDVLQR